LSPALAQRLIILAAIGLLVVVAGFAIVSDKVGGDDGSGLPAKVGSWYQARAAPMSRDLEGTTTTCGVRLSAKSLGIADPVLPCGAKVYIDYDDQSVLTQVIAVGPAPGGARFGVTPALAETLGIDRTVTVRWGYPALE
jgi:hypothetical protein